MKFYRFHQNNSGGDFDFNHELGLGENVYIQAESPDAANIKAQEIGIYFDGVSDDKDCSCCGDRWYPVGHFEAGDEPTATKSLFDWGPSFVHYADGTFKQLEKE